jgi:hypothetical protein
MAREGATTDVNFSEKWHEKVRPVIAQCAPKDILNMDKTALFYNA